MREKKENNSIDLFGDAYEYLMTMYAADAGRSGGEFFTPQEVSELLAKITLVGRTEVNKVYDPACGSGSLLLKFAKVLGKENIQNGFYGQEINPTTYNLCRINMFLHDINYEMFDIALGDTLTKPCLGHKNCEPFEAIVSNPPYSTKWEGHQNPVLINDPRFTPAGVLAPENRADLAFVMHVIAWLSNNGTAAIVSFPGTLSRKGKEKTIRKYLVDNNYIDSVFQLPPNLFYGTSIATCILVLRKNKTDNNVLFVDGADECVQLGSKNKLENKNIENLLNLFIERKTKPDLSTLVTYEQIQSNDYDLNVKKYVVARRNKLNLNVELHNAEITEIVARQNKLRGDISRHIEKMKGAKDVRKAK